MKLRRHFILESANSTIYLSTVLLRTPFTKEEDGSIVTSDLDLDIAFHTAHTLTSPHVNNIIRRASLKLRNLLILGTHRHSLSRGVEKRNHRAVARRARPVHRRVSAVKRVIRVDPPLVGPGGFADDRILVEREQVLVLQDVDLFLRQVREVGSHQQRAFHHRPQSEVRVFLFDREAVAHLRCFVSIFFAGVWLDWTLTSSMSGSLRPQKSVQSSRKEFTFRISRMRPQEAVCACQQALIYSSLGLSGTYHLRIQYRSTCATNFQSGCPRSILGRHLEKLRQLHGFREFWIDLKWSRHTPLAQAVQNRTVLRFQRALHDAELQRGVLGRVVDAVNREVIGAESTGVVPGIVASGRSSIGTAAVHFADAVKVRVAVASEAVVDPDLRREAVVVL